MNPLLDAPHRRDVIIGEDGSEWLIRLFALETDGVIRDVRYTISRVVHREPDRRPVFLDRTYDRRKPVMTYEPADATIAATCSLRHDGITTVNVEAVVDSKAMLWGLLAALEQARREAALEMGSAYMEGPALPLTPPRVVRDPPICQIADDIDNLASTIFTRTGRHGITRISLTPDVGLAFGIAPETSVDVQTSVGRVEVYAERAVFDEVAQRYSDLRLDAAREMLETSLGAIPIYADPTMPPGTFEMRSGAQRIRTTADPEGDDHAKRLAMQAWFASRGAPSGSFVDDPDDCRKQNEARDAFEAWWRDER